MTTDRHRADAGELEKVKRLVVRTLLDGPRSGMPLWGHRGISEALPGSMKALLLLAVDELCAEETLTLRPTVYRTRGGRRAVLLDPFSPYGNRIPQPRDSRGRYLPSVDPQDAGNDEQSVA